MRLTRGRYWAATALQGAVVTSLVAADLLVFGDDGLAPGGLRAGLGLATALVAVAGVALTVRRLRDAGRSGWWFLLGAIPVVGGPLLFVQASRRDRDDRRGAPTSCRDAAGRRRRTPVTAPSSRSVRHDGGGDPMS